MGVFYEEGEKQSEEFYNCVECFGAKKVNEYNYCRSCGEDNKD